MSQSSGHPLPSVSSAQIGVFGQFRDRVEIHKGQMDARTLLCMVRKGWLTGPDLDTGLVRLTHKGRQVFEQLVDAKPASKPRKQNGEGRSDEEGTTGARHTASPDRPEPAKANTRANAEGDEDLEEALVAVQGAIERKIAELREQLQKLEGLQRGLALLDKP